MYGYYGEKLHANHFWELKSEKSINRSFLLISRAEVNAFEWNKFILFDELSM